MTRPAVTVVTFLSVVFLPWQVTVLCALGAAVVEPFVPLAAGLLLDVLYYAPQTGLLPRFTIGGALISLVASVVHSRVRARSM
ncbi:MAG: hypothetical protein WC030_01005 [Candidatus Paceibacterota bacterium]